MKANELMIGDWVKVTDDDTDDSFIGQVNAIDELENINVPEGEDVAYPYSIDCLEPIPLTPEILERNGFDKYGENFIYEKDGLYMQIKLGAFVRIFCGMDNSVNFNRDFYVHTLQHALRLCGIEKEITLQDMKAPDKIYVLLDKTSGFLSHTFTNIPCNYEGSKQDIEYIRKDCLLKFVNKKLQESADRLDFHANRAYSEVFDKLNEI